MNQAVQAELPPFAGPQPTALPPVHLEQFDGPLDVLLHLIRSQELDIFDIPIAMLTRQYLDILEAREQMDLDVAGDYLVMASTLMQLKSRMLLPRPQVDDEGNAVDPRAELAAQLIAYEQYRALSESLNERDLLQRDVFTRTYFPETEHIERPQPQADLDALLLAFRRVLKRVGGEVRHHIFTDTMSMREQMSVLLERLQGAGLMQLDELLAGSPGREALVTTLLAMLELWRQRTITVVQAENYGSISLLLKQPDESDQPSENRPDEQAGRPPDNQTAHST